MTYNVCIPVKKLPSFANFDIHIINLLLQVLNQTINLKNYT